MKSSSLSSDTSLMLDRDVEEANAPEDPIDSLNSLQSAIESSLCAAQHYAKQMRRVDELKAKLTANTNLRG